jgi:hypothetical protein
VDLAPHRETVAAALRALEASSARLIDALAHQPVWIRVDGATTDRAALQQACAAYATFDYAMDDAAGSSPVCLGVLGVAADIVKRAQALNAAKAAFKEICAPLQTIRTRVPDGDGTKAIPLIRAVLRSIQRSDLNLLAAYRKIPLLEAPPATITYTRARTRAVYRKSVEEIYNLLVTLEGPQAAADRARLAALGRQEKFLAIARPHYDNVRANIVYARLDSRGRGRVQMAAELPLMYGAGRHHVPPEVRFAPLLDDEAALPRRVRQRNLESEPFLVCIPAYRYASRSR